MQAMFTIGDYSFLAPSLLEATGIALANARLMYKAGRTAEARALYDEAYALRQDLQRQTPRESYLPRRRRQEVLSCHQCFLAERHAAGHR